MHVTLAALERDAKTGFEWTPSELEEFRAAMLATLRPARPPARGISPYELTCQLRELFPRDTILATDVGAIKSITSQAWAAYEPLTFFESNGLSAMGYGFAGAMAAKVLFPDRAVLCTIGDGGFGMRLAEVETCVRCGINIVTVVFNDSSLSLIQVSQENKGHPNYGVDHGPMDFAAIAAAFGCWSRHVNSLDQLDAAVTEALAAGGPAVIDVAIDATEYRRHNAPNRKSIPLANAAVSGP